MTILFFFLYALIYSYEASLINLKLPSALDPPSLELTLQHRFSRVLWEKIDYSFFGSASFNLGIRGCVWKGLEASFDYYVPDNDIDIGAGYSYDIFKRWLAAEAAVHLFSLDYNQQRYTNLFYLFSASTQPFSERLWLVLNLSFDGFKEYFVPSVGFVVRIAEPFDIVGEYSFTHDAYETGGRNNNTYALGFKINTYAHHFKFIFTNGFDIGARRATAGAHSNDLLFGFSIQRKFEW